MHRPARENQSPLHAEVRRAVAAGFSSESEGLTAERAAMTRLADDPATRRMLATHATAAVDRAILSRACQSRARHCRGVSASSAAANWAPRSHATLARHGHEIFVQERSPIESGDVPRRVANHLATACAAANCPHARQHARRISIRATTEWIGFDNADFVIEAATEDPGIKRNVFQELESRVRPRVILATASSTVPVESIQSEMSRPGRIAGLHVPNLSAGDPLLSWSPRP